MLVLFESAAGPAIFKLKDAGVLDRVDDLYKEFQTPEAANSLLKLQAFVPYTEMTDALAAATGIVEGELSKTLKSFLKTHVVKAGLTGDLAVADAKLGGVIKEKLGIPIMAGAAVFELMRCIRGQITNLIPQLSEKDLKTMQLGVAHSLSRYKLKFSTEKVDTMIIQAIGLLDDLDKELNTYSMRVREWYGWHFPELSKIIENNAMYANIIMKMGVRTNAKTMDLTDFVPEELVQPIRDMAQVSMGTEISSEDMENISYLCEQVLAITDYRAELFDYLKNRMAAIAPNLTQLVGELVGARLISHAGSLLNLAKQPASTIQILGAEKALFRALKTKHETPKYGLIYHASLVGQASAKNKGKVSRVLAAKAALSIRCDALGDEDTPHIGAETRAKIEQRVRQLEGKSVKETTGGAATPKNAKAYVKPGSTPSYNPAADSTIGVKRKRDDDEEEEEGQKKKKKKKKAEESVEAAVVAAIIEDADKAKKKKKKKSKKAEEETPAEEEAVAEPEAPATEKKKKKKKSKKAAVEEE
jgi:nucleolar protein 58